jgi:hypothetical protein
MNTYHTRSEMYSNKINSDLDGWLTWSAYPGNANTKLLTTFRFRFWLSQKPENPSQISKTFYTRFHTQNFFRAKFYRRKTLYPQTTLTSATKETVIFFYLLEKKRNIRNARHVLNDISITGFHAPYLFQWSVITFIDPTSCSVDIIVPVQIVWLHSNTETHGKKK